MYKKQLPFDANALHEIRLRLSSQTEGSQQRNLTHILDRTDEWALQHIRVTDLEPLKEAVDEDASGYVSIWEANAFTSAAPGRNSEILKWRCVFVGTRHHLLY